MTAAPTPQFSRTLLCCGIAVPLVYFGIQLVAAPFCPGYSFFSDDASTLGSPDSSFPALFNVASGIVGLLLLAFAAGSTHHLFRVGARPWATIVLLLATICGAIACFNAAAFPLPDERHTSGLLATLGMLFFFLPFVLPLVFRPAPEHATVRTYFWINLATLVCLVPIVSGLIQRLQASLGVDLPWYQEFLNNGSGVLQRIAAAIVFVPIGVLSWHLLQIDKGQTKAQAAR